MTEEFKQTLFDYLIGKLPKEQGTTEEIFKDVTTGYLPKIIEQFPENTDTYIEGILQVQNTMFFVLYGGYQNTSTKESHGIIIILDNFFNIVTSFLQYENGTYLDYIMCMIQESDGTFTMTTCSDFPKNKEWSFTTSVKKLVMLSNFTQQINSKYILTIRKTYNIPYQNNYIRKIFKDPNSSHYVLICSMLLDQNSPDYDKTRVIESKINVGSENEWSNYDTETNWILGDSYVEFDNNSNSFIELLLSTNLTSRGNVIGTWTKNFNDKNFVYKDIHTFSYRPYIDNLTMNNQCVFLNRNEVYFVQNNQHWGTSGNIEPKYIGLYYYNVSSEEFRTIYEKFLGNYDYSQIEEIYITSLNNELYIELVNDQQRQFFLQRYDGKWNPQYIGTTSLFYFSDCVLIATNQYNLVSLISFSNDNAFQFDWLVKENYNSTKYNGQSYINTNALIADSAEIYSNDSLVFARDLYNKSLNNNTTVSTVEVPNNYLNDIDLTSKNLLSETNLDIIEDTNMLQKNIYETLYINFINTLLIIDRNNTNQVINQQASTYLNNAINTADSYDSAKLYNKVIINYQDGSSKEVSYAHEDNTEISTVIAFGLYVDKLINNAEFVSNDKRTVYQTIDLSNLELNKYYAIRQKLEVV